MKEILLSFHPRAYGPLYDGIKMYEYRRRWCHEETKAYLYLSGNIRKIVGVMMLGEKIRLDLTRDDYLKYPDTLKRVDEYINEGDVNAIPIKSLTLFKEPISLESIRGLVPGFMPPRMYYVLKEEDSLKRMLDERELEKTLFVHKHKDIYYDNLGKYWILCAKIKNIWYHSS